MDAFKSFAVDAPDELALNSNFPDVEVCLRKPYPEQSFIVEFQDLGREASRNSGKRCWGPHKMFERHGDWYVPRNLQQLLELTNSLKNRSTYCLVAGNTGKGIPNAHMFENNC